MKIMKRLLAITALTVAATGAAPAWAQSFSYTFAGVPSSNTSGSFTITGTSGAYTLAAFTGQINGASYSLATVGFGYDSPSAIYFGGLLNGIGTANYGTNDFYENGDFTPGKTAFADSFTYTAPGLATSAIVAVTFTPVLSVVPEPATWAMMVLGMGAVGFAMRRQKLTMRVSYAA